MSLNSAFVICVKTGRSNWQTEAAELFLEGRPRGEVAGPERVRVGGVGEKVVRLGRPSPLGLVQRLEVARRRRVEGVDGFLARRRLAVVQARVDVLYELVEVLVPRVGVLGGNSIGLILARELARESI